MFKPYNFCFSISSSNRDSDSDSSTDTEISVGVDFPPVPYHSPIFSSSSSSISLDSVSDIRLRPGPRSFKLQQQLEQKMSKWSDHNYNNNHSNNIFSHMGYFNRTQLTFCLI